LIFINVAEGCGRTYAISKDFAGQPLSNSVFMVSPVGKLPDLSKNVVSFYQ